MPGSKRWCFTINNALASTWRPQFKEEDMDFMVWEREVAPTTGMAHLQGYVRFKVRKTLVGVKRFLTLDAHLEAARGSEEENYAYCTKERLSSDDWAEYGNYDPEIRQGRRSDLEDVIKDVNAGA